MKEQGDTEPEEPCELSVFEAALRHPLAASIEDYFLYGSRDQDYFGAALRCNTESKIVRQVFV